MHAEGGDLLPAGPDARQARLARGGDPEAAEGADQDLLEIAEVAADVAPVRPEVQDRVADELPGTVVGHLPAAVGALDPHAAGLERRGVEQHIGGAGVAAKRDDRRVLQQQQVLPILAIPVFQPPREPVLEGGGLGIAEASEVEGCAASHDRSGKRPSCSVSLTCAMN